MRDAAAGKFRVTGEGAEGAEGAGDRVRKLGETRVPPLLPPCRRKRPPLVRDFDVELAAWI